MIDRKLLRTFALALVSVITADAQPAAERVDKLLQSMTLEEKVGQMTQADYGALKGRTDDVTKYALGSVLWGGGTELPEISSEHWARASGELQGLAAKTRLRIPLVLGIDAVHGHNNLTDAVMMPHNIGLGATRDAAIVEAVARVTAVEMQATGMNWAFAPCVAVARDERWGRTYESFGEDPDLVRQMGVAHLRGLQGASLSNPTSALACVKHYVGDGGTTGGKDQGNTEVDEATLRRIHLPGYIDAIKAGARSIMASYNSWNGNKLHGHRYLMTDVLKGELKFSGFIVSDWAGIDQLPGTYRDQIAASVNAGLDMAMIPNGPGTPNNYVDFITELTKLVNEGVVPMSRINDAVRRILTVKMEMGLLRRSPGPAVGLETVGSKAHRKVAREAVRKSIVLLKNENKVLPLSKTSKRITVAGPAADDMSVQCGGWTIDWQGKEGRRVIGGTTILHAVEQSVGAGATVTYSTNGTGADSADAVIVVVGEEPYAEMFGDRKDLRLSDADRAVIETVFATGRPTIVVLLSGRPIIIDDLMTKCHALVAAWLPGSEGAGVTDVLFGDVAPTGKLSHTWPRSMDQVPVNVGDPNIDPLFPYGYGLSY
ncbi:MAG: glycoside hydrolase family 3 C-terminal domain-containing protein [Bacteroidetes bacterium]|jgi:beta-glucosidase|nr:glycoside hydrolase family 3 C-terminal domain-containing protein [Bacteroidota bacterium]